MADQKISQLTSVTTPLAGTEVLPIVQSGSTKKVAADDLTVRNVRAKATTGILQVAGPAAGTTRTMTTPNADFTVARTDASQSFTGTQTIETAAINYLQGANAAGNFTPDTNWQNLFVENGAASYLVIVGTSAPSYHARSVFIVSNCFGSTATATLIASTFGGQGLSIQWSGGNTLQAKTTVDVAGLSHTSTFSAIKIL